MRIVTAPAGCFDPADSRRRLSPHQARSLTQPTYNSTSTLATTAAGIPTIAIVGRPNVGKSTLFNRIVGSRRAIVGDEPGITRDRLYGDAEWEGRQLRIVDTGGILPEEKDFIPSEIYRQARVALDEAAAIIMVVDGRTGTRRSRPRTGAPAAKGEPSAFPGREQSRQRQAIVISWMISIAWASRKCSPFPPSMAAALTICWMR